MNLIHGYKTAKAWELVTHSHTFKKPENPARILRAKDVEAAKGRENLGSLNQKKWAVIWAQENRFQKFRRSEKRPLMAVRVPSILQKQCWQGNWLWSCITKGKEKNQLKDRASHGEKTGKLKKKKKKRAERVKEFLKIFKSLQGMSTVWKNLGGQSVENTHSMSLFYKIQAF